MGDVGDLAGVRRQRRILRDHLKHTGGLLIQRIITILHNRVVRLLISTAREFREFGPRIYQMISDNMHAVEDIILFHEEVKYVVFLTNK